MKPEEFNGIPYCSLEQMDALLRMEKRMNTLEKRVGRLTLLAVILGITALIQKKGVSFTLEPKKENENEK